METQENVLRSIDDASHMIKDCKKHGGESCLYCKWDSSCDILFESEMFNNKMDLREISAMIVWREYKIQLIRWKLDHI